MVHGHGQRDVETTLNAHLARMLDGMRHNWTAKTEQSGMMERPARIDVLVVEDGWPHVILECKMGIKPEDLAKRFDNTFRHDGMPPRVIFEVKYDHSIRSDGDLESTEKLHYCVHYDKHTRFPRSGWLTGSVRDLVIAIQYGRQTAGYMSGVDTLTDAIWEAAKRIGRTGRRGAISRIMAQDESEQTDAMAALTLAGALSFHDTAAGSREGIPLLGEVMFGGMADVAALSKAWHSILDINYYPIFDPAAKILNSLPIDEAAIIAGSLHVANSRIRAKGLDNSPDLYGQVFQSLIADRKKLAAFYTKPAAAALLAALTIPDEWLDEQSVRGLRVADFACGTGALLLAAYRQVAARYEAASGSSMRELHPHMMAECLVGADVLPIAAHLTAAGLTGMYPKQRYDHTRIYQPEQGGKDSRLGSLEWIRSNATLDKSEYRLTGTGVSGEMDAPGHDSCDIIVMNPPYVGSQGPGGRTDDKDMRQVFTAFGATPANRRRMSTRAAELFRNAVKSSRKKYCADKRSLATFFVDLANAKLRGGGLSWSGPADDRRYRRQVAEIPRHNAHAIYRDCGSKREVLGGYWYGGNHCFGPQTQRRREAIWSRAVRVAGPYTRINAGGGVHRRLNMGCSPTTVGGPATGRDTSHGGRQRGRHDHQLSVGCRVARRHIQPHTAADLIPNGARQPVRPAGVRARWPAHHSVERCGTYRTVPPADTRRGCPARHVDQLFGAVQHAGVEAGMSVSRTLE